MKRSPTLLLTLALLLALAPLALADKPPEYDCPSIVYVEVGESKTFTLKWIENGAICEAPPRFYSSDESIFTCAGGGRTKDSVDITVTGVKKGRAKLIVSMPYGTSDGTVGQLDKEIDVNVGRDGWIAPSFGAAPNVTMDKVGQSMTVHIPFDPGTAKMVSTYYQNPIKCDLNGVNITADSYDATITSTKSGYGSIVLGYVYKDESGEKELSIEVTVLVHVTSTYSPPAFGALSNVTLRVGETKNVGLAFNPGTAQFVSAVPSTHKGIYTVGNASVTSDSITWTITGVGEGKSTYTLRYTYLNDLGNEITVTLFYRIVIVESEPEEVTASPAAVVGPVAAAKPQIFVDLSVGEDKLLVLNIHTEAADGDKLKKLIIYSETEGKKNVVAQVNLNGYEKRNFDFPIETPGAYTVYVEDLNGKGKTYPIEFIIAGESAPESYQVGIEGVVVPIE